VQQPGTPTVAAGAAIHSDPSSVDVVLLTADLKLLSTMREAASAHHELWHADSANSAAELLMGGHSGILVADLAQVEGDAVSLFERLQKQFPELIILATGRREEEAAVAGAISSGCIYRFLHKPVSTARAAQFLGTATRRYGELREVEALALATIQQAANRPRLAKFGPGVTAAVIVGAACVWWGMHRQQHPAVTTTVRSPVDEFLSRAQEAFKAGRLSDETNENSLALYRSALAVAPDSEAARAGIKRVIAALDKRAALELRRGDVVAATAAVAELQRAHPAHPHLAGLQRQLRALPPAPPPVLAEQGTVTKPSVLPRDANTR